MQVQYLLNDSNAIETWVSPFPYAAIVISKLNINELGAVIRERLPGVWFMVTELKSGTVQGWIPGDLWQYVNDPQGVWTRKQLADLLISPVPTGTTPVRGLF